MRVLLVLLAFVYSGFILLPECSSDDGDCSMRAIYYASTNTTYWVAACADGSVINGAMGGDATSYICGA